MTADDPKDPPSPRKLWLEAGGDQDKYIALMIEHGHIEPVKPLTPDPWEQVALAAKVTAEANAPICSKCRRLVSLTDKGIVKVHFASTTDTRPCPASYQPWTG